MKAKNIIIPGVLIVATIVCLILFFRTKKKNETQQEIDEEQSALEAIASIEHNGNNQQYPLVYNPHVKSLLVEDLQHKLNIRLQGWVAPLVFPLREDGTRIEKLKEDGYFGAETLAVVKYFWHNQTQVTEEMVSNL